MSSNYIKLFACDSCGNVILSGRLHDAALAVDESGTVGISVAAVEHAIASAFARGDARVVAGECWVCACDRRTSLEQFHVKR